MDQAEHFEVNSAEIVSEVIDGEAVIINLASGIYYSLDGAGGLAWAMLAGGHTRSETAEAIAATYGVDSARAGNDLDTLIGDFGAEGLVAEAQSAGGPRHVSDDALPAEGGEYQAPRLKRFDDLGQLLAVDPPMPQVAQSPWESPQA